MILKKFIKGILWVPSFLVLLGFRLIRPLVRVELLVVAFHRFGHLALEPEVFLSRTESELAKSPKRKRFPITLRLWSLGPRRAKSNRVLAKMWKKVLLVPPSWLVDSLFHTGEKFRSIRLESPKLSIQGQNNSLDDSQSHLVFTSSQMENGKSELAKLGIDPGKPMVCLIVRDDGYYKSRGEFENPLNSVFNFDITSFEDAASSLAARGYQVIRMGTGSEKPMDLSVDGVFDYAISPYRSEFLDVYIAANCDFAISTQTGPDCVCLAFRRPVCYIDVTRFSQFFFGTKFAYWNPSLLEKDGRRLTLREIVSTDVMWIKDPIEFGKQRIESTRSSPKKIDDLVCGFAELAENSFEWSPDDKRLNVRAQEIIATGMGDRGATTFGRISSSLNPVFLREHGEWFLA